MKTNRFLAIIVTVVLLLCFSLSTFAAGVQENSELPIFKNDRKTETQEGDIIGQSDIAPTPKVPNVLTVTWVASANQVIISVKNVGVDTVDLFAGSVTVKGGNKSSFSASNLKPLTTRQVTVNINMTKCYEDIVVSYYGIDAGKEFGQGSSSGHRELPSDLTSLWLMGTFSSVYASINYHYSKHHAEVNANDIQTYTTKAKNYRNAVVLDLLNLSNIELQNTYIISVSSGATKAHKFKHKFNAQFAILSDSGRKILSYGR